MGLFTQLSVDLPTPVLECCSRLCWKAEDSVTMGDFRTTPTQCEKNSDNDNDDDDNDNNNDEKKKT